MDRKLFEFLRYSEDKVRTSRRHFIGAYFCIRSTAFSLPLIHSVTSAFGIVSWNHRFAGSSAAVALTPGKIFQLDQSIGQEKETLKAIEHMQEENTAALDKV